ncbi:hypothetical protein ACJX0J_022258, partial [Zea mays]
MENFRWFYLIIYIHSFEVCGEILISTVELSLERMPHSLATNHILSVDLGTRRSKASENIQQYPLKNKTLRILFKKILMGLTYLKKENIYLIWQNMVIPELENVGGFSGLATTLLRRIRA